MRQLTPPQMVKALGLLADDKEWRKELRKTYREVGKVGAQFARDGMRSSGDAQLAAAARGGIRGGSNATSARVAVRQGRTAAAVYGTKGRTGWFARARYAGSASRNNPAWIGNSWRTAVRGEGPRGVNDGLAAGEGKIVDQFKKSATTLIDRAF